MTSRKRRTAIVLLLSLIAATLLVEAPTARAGNFADADADCAYDPCRANNAYHWFAYACTSGPDIVEGFERTRQWSYEPTTLVTSNHGTCVGDSTNWDVYSEKCYGCVGAAGIALCYWSTSGPGYEYCNHSHVIFDGSYTDAYDAGQMQELACHEVGHTVGLEHGPYSPSSESTWGCMVTSTPVDGTGDSRWLRAHNEDHINSWY